MAKTRSQTRNITIKKEEKEEKDRKPALVLHSVSNTRNNNRITKREPPIVKNNLPAPDIKVEEDTDTKSLLQASSNYSKLPKVQTISQEQINQLVDYVVNHGMSVKKASRKAKMSIHSGYKYYNEYKNDPDKKVPLPRNRFTYPNRVYTQEHIENLIRYITTDKLDVKKASVKANMSYTSGLYHYYKCLKDPNYKIPIQQPRQRNRQDQINEFIGYIVNDKMSIRAASKKAKMCSDSGSRYYHKYFDDGNPDVPTPSHITIPKRYTQDQKNKLISYIIDDKMPIAAASRKANICVVTARYYYRQYLKDHNMEKTMPECGKRYTQDQKDDFIRFIVDDKMNIPAASKKANMYYDSARKYFQKYLKKNNLDISTRRYPQERVDELVGYIVDDKMTVKAASRKANINYSSGKAYYQKYRVNHNLDMSDPKCTAQDKVNELIGYVVNDKMTIAAASRKANMSYRASYKYYQKYLNRDASG